MSSTGNLIVYNTAEKGNLTKIKVRQFQQQQLEQFDALLANYNWSSVFNTSGIDRKVNTFLQITENMISECFPENTRIRFSSCTIRRVGRR